MRRLLSTGFFIVAQPVNCRLDRVIAFLQCLLAKLHRKLRDLAQLLDVCDRWLKERGRERGKRERGIITREKRLSYLQAIELRKKRGRGGERESGKARSGQEVSE